jgi:hypothetical protein
MQLAAHSLLFFMIISKFDTSDVFSEQKLRKYCLDFSKGKPLDTICFIMYSLNRIIFENSIQFVKTHVI